MKKIVISLGLLLTSPAFAQTPDPAFMNKALASIQQQRNSAMDAAASAEARVALLQDELNRMAAKIKSMEDERAKKADESK